MFSRLFKKPQTTRNPQPATRNPQQATSNQATSNKQQKGSCKLLASSFNLTEKACSS